MQAALDCIRDAFPRGNFWPGGGTWESRRDFPQNTRVGKSEDDPPGMEKRSSTDPGSRGLSRTDGRMNTPESYKTRGEGPNAPDG